MSSSNIPNRLSVCNYYLYKMCRKQCFTQTVGWKMSSSFSPPTSDSHRNCYSDNKVLPRETYENTTYPSSPWSIPVVDKSEVSEVGFRGQCVQVLSILAVRPWATSVSHFLICEVGALMHHLTGLLGELIYANWFKSYLEHSQCHVSVSHYYLGFSRVN